MNRSRKCMLVIGIVATAWTGAAHGKSSTCSDERKQCHLRCEYSYGFKGSQLHRCRNISCDSMFEQCKATGWWYITRTKTAIGPLEKR